jgi:hypothetical protein
MYGNSQGSSYAADSYKKYPAAGSYGSMPYAQPAPYKTQYGAAYQPEAQEPPHSYTLTQPKEPYAGSYQAPGTAYTPHRSYEMGSEYPDAAPMDPSRSYAMPQQPIRGANKAASEDTGSKAQPKAAPKQHHPTVVHQDDPYRQQQLQQQEVLNALSNSNAVSNNNALSTAVLGNPALANAVLSNPALANAVLGNAALGTAGLGNAALGNAALGNAVLGNAGLGSGLLANAALGSSGYGGMYNQPTNPSGSSNIKATGGG